VVRFGYVLGWKLNISEHIPSLVIWKELQHTRVNY